MLPLPVYYAFLTLCLTYALMRGGSPERIGAAIIAIGSVISAALVWGRADHHRWVETGVLWIDVACFVAFTMLALRADRFWTLWVSALAGLGILGHVGRWYLGPGIGRGAYIISLVVWSYPILVVIALGTFNHQRRTAVHPEVWPPTGKATGTRS